MARTIQVVLNEDMPNIGQSGELARVRPGYARNFLVPRGLAATATKRNVAQVEHAKRVAEARAKKMRSAAETLATELATVKLTLSCAVGEEGKLYGSVGTRDIAEALAAAGHELDRRKIVMEPIRELGEFDVSIKLGKGVEAIVKVTVVAAESDA